MHVGVAADPVDHGEGTGILAVHGAGPTPDDHVAAAGGVDREGQGLVVGRWRPGQQRTGRRCGSQPGSRSRSNRGECPPEIHRARGHRNGVDKRARLRIEGLVQLARRSVSIDAMFFRASVPSPCRTAHLCRIVFLSGDATTERTIAAAVPARHGQRAARRRGIPVAASSTTRLGPIQARKRCPQRCPEGGPE